MRKTHANNILRYMPFIAVAPFLIYFLWISSHYVTAYQETKHAHVFPTNVSAQGFADPTNALYQDLPGRAPYAAFSEANSAHVDLAASTSTGPVFPGETQSSSTPLTSSSTPVISTSSLQTTPTPAATSTQPMPPAVTLPLPQIISTTTNTESSTSTDSSDSSDGNILDDAPLFPPLFINPSFDESTSGEQVFIIPETNDTSASSTGTSPTSTAPILPIQGSTTSTSTNATSTSMLKDLAPIAGDLLHKISEFIFSQVVGTAYATTVSGSSTISVNTTTPALIAVASSTNATTSATVTSSDSGTKPKDTQNVSSCAVLGTPCYTMEFTGFAVAGSLTDKDFQSARINFSFGANVPESAFEDSHVYVRYFHSGLWHTAGEVFVNKELSNQSNGGYFSAKLDGIDSWNDLSDIRIEVEFVRGDERSPVTLYLESLWIDTVFKDRVQDILSGNADSSIQDAPENVNFGEPANIDQSKTLILDGGDEVDFPYVNQLGGGLVLRADKSSYSSKDSPTSYISITNTADKPDNLQLYVSFPGGVGTTTELEEYMRNVPKISTSTISDDVTYFCESGWREATSTNSISGNRYKCEPTGETEECSSLDDLDINCLSKGVPISTATTTAYGSAWVPVELNGTSGRNTALKGTLPPGYFVNSISAGTIEILPGQTVYFKLTVDTPDSESKRFVLTAKGSNATANLNSLRLRNESLLLSAAKDKKGPARMRFNNEISDKNDFNINELPSFRFKFITQRSFFTRVFDNLLGKQVPYEITAAKLVHADDTTEHIPIKVTYGNNGEWQLQLEQKQRAFKPGRYTIELTLSENGNTYSDSLDFYWGVIAINPDQSSYKPGETAHFSIAALNEAGDTVCDAQLALTITSPEGNVADIPVISGGGCGHNNVTEIDDYVANYPVQAAGTYALTLSSLDDDGNVVNSVNDNFLVTSTSTFVVTRHGPTRIYPVSAYTMHFSVTAAVPFNGEITEVVPEGFTVPDTHGSTLNYENSEAHLTWHAQLQPGETKDFQYTFKAPVVSPYLFLAGPLVLKDARTDMEIFSEPRAWNIASDALSIATGVAWLSGTTTTSGTDLNVNSPSAIQWTTDDYDDTYFSHSTTTNSTKLTVLQAGDYLVSLTLPVERTDGANRLTMLESYIATGTVKVNQGVARHAYAERGTQQESSEHITMLLHNMNANDFIEAYTWLISTINANNHIAIGSQASMYVEYIPASETVFSASATTTTFGPNLNGTATSALMWFNTDSMNRVDSGYTHVNGPATSSSEIVLSAIGDYLVYVNVPVSGNTVDVRVKNRVLLNGVMASSSDFRQGYIAGATGIASSSNNWSGIVHSTTTNTKLTVTTRQGTAAATEDVGQDVASIYIQKLPSSDVYSARATTTSAGSTAFNQAANVLWQFDDIKDSSTFTHVTTSSPETITVKKAGDYLLVLNEDLFASPSLINRANPKAQVLVNGAIGTVALGAQAKGTFVTNTAGDGYTNPTLVYLLRNLNINDTVSVQQSNAGVAGTMIADRNASLTLWHKQAQSSWIQDTYAWYSNIDSLTSTSRWQGTTNDGDQITTSGDVLSGTTTRLRMSLQAQVDVATSTDTFKLQYAAGETCAPSLTWADVGATTSSSIWKFYNNPSVADGATTTLLLSLATSSAQSYGEGNPTPANLSAVSVGTDGEWDWAIQDNGAAVGTSYCFRMIHSSGQVLKDFNDYPQLITNNSPNAPTLLTLFDNEKSTSTLPWFTWNASDDDGDNINYQIQVSTVSDFSSTVIDQDSTSNFTDFDNVSNSGNVAPFISGDTIRYKHSGAALTNGITYYWRVRGKDNDTGGTGLSGSWSSTYSFTIDTSVTVSTWYQAKSFQFNEGTLSNLTATDTVQLSGANTTGTIWGPAITYSSLVNGNSWGTVSWQDFQSLTNTIKYHVEYFTSTSSWALVPDTDLSGNGAGTSTPSIVIAGLDPATYDTLRVRADFTKVTNHPVLRNWTINWAFSVNRPTVSKLFDNEKTGTTTPYFTFTTTDPQSNDLVYQVQWATDYAFSSIVGSSTSNNVQPVVNSGYFYSATTTSDASPFFSNTNVNMQISTSSALTNGQTYWLRVRAKDPTGGNAFSLWSTPRSFTVDTTVDRSTWFQTTTDQFNTDALVRTLGSGNAATVAQDTGKIAIYRNVTAGNAITTTALTLPFTGVGSTVRQDSIYSMSNGSSTIRLQTGYYAVMYNLRFDRNDANTTRSVIQSDLLMSSTSLPIGWAQGFMRRNGGANMAFNTGGGIIKVTSDNTPLVLQAYRTDNTATNLVNWTANTSGIQLVRLDSNWHYLRLSKTVTQTGPTSAGTPSNWPTKVQYNSEDEVDTSYYSHSPGDSVITLKNTGHYLVFANTFGTIPTNSATANEINQKLVLNGSDVQGSFSSVFVSGSTNQGIFEGANSIGMIIEATTSNSTLTVQLNHTTGSASWTINKSGATYVNRTALTIVKIPEGDFIRMSTTSVNINPAALTQTFWSATRTEYDTASFSQWTGGSTSSRIQTLISGDYLAFAGASEMNQTAIASAETNIGFEKNGSGLIQYGQGGMFANAAAYSISQWAGNIFPGMTSSDYFEVYNQHLGATGIINASSSVQAVRISSLSEADNNLQTVTGTDVVFANGDGPRWDKITMTHSKPGSSSILYQLYYLNSISNTYLLVPNAVLLANNPQMDNGSTTMGTSTGPIDISGLDRVIYGTLHLLATLTCGGGSCPSISDWTFTWNPGITVSGTAKQYDMATDVTSGTVSVAVNGVLSTKTGTISGGTWSISNVNIYTGDIVEVFVSDAATTTRAVAITKYTGSGGSLTGMALNQMTVTLGSADNPTLTNADLGLYDYSSTANSKVFHDVNGSNLLNACATTECFTSRLLIKAGTIFQPSSTSNGNVTTRHFLNRGTLIADGNTIRVSGSWQNTNVFVKNTSTVIFTATSSTETIDSSAATSSGVFNIVTFGETSGSALWQLKSPLSASSTLSLSFGTLAPGSTSTIFLSGDLTIGSGGFFAKNASTTFMGIAETWSDNNAAAAAKVDMGDVRVGGASTTVTLASVVKMTDLQINSGGMLDASASNFDVYINGNWTNNNIFVARSATTTLLATTTGKSLAVGNSAFYNLTFNGANGNWSFPQANATTTNDFRIATGTVTLPTGTTTVGGSWDTFVATGTPFQPNNGTVLFNSTAAGKTIHVATSTEFTYLSFNGSGGAWSFIDQNATSSKSVVISAGTVTLPSGTFAIGLSYAKNGGTVTHNSGTLKFYSTASGQTIALGGSDAFSMTFNGIGGGWTFLDTNATSSGNFRIENGTTTMPTGSLGVGGSFVNANSPSSGFNNSSGIVRLTSTAGGNTVLATGSNFYDLIFNGVGGGWTISGSATSTRNTIFTQANTITLSSGKTLEVDGMFTNSLANAATTWTGASLYLNSGTTYAINAKGASGDTYNQLTLSGGTNVSLWNSSATTVFTSATSSIYSQNNASTSGQLYIYGTFATSSNVYWDYTKDFDGISLPAGASQRQVSVKIASSSIVTLTGSSSIQGITTASTTIANQGVGLYSFNITAGTTTAKYYSFASTTPNGLQIFGANTVISSLDNGEFVLNTSSTTAISVGPEVINKNPQIQILYVRFATTTGVVVADNVRSTTTAGVGNYWWFKNGYGNLYGENYDYDFGGNPGQIQFDDSGITVNIQGHVYTDHYGTAMGNAVCQTGTTSAKIIIRTSGGLSYSGTCDNSGFFSIPATFTTSNILTAYIDTNGGPRAVTITKNVTAIISDFDLYQNAVIVRQFDTTPTTIADMNFTDSTIDSDIPFTATSSLMVRPNTELYIWTGKFFSPGGDIILQSGGSGLATDGRLYLATSSTFTLSGSPNIALGGGLQVDTGATFTTASSNFVFTATTTGKNIFGTRPIVFNNVVFNGSGGSWFINGTSTATTTIQAITFTAGTLTGPGDVDIKTGGITGGGTIAMTGGTFLIEDSGSFGNANQWSFNNLTFGTSTTQAVTKTGAATTTVAGVLKIATSMTLNAGASASYAWILSGIGTPFVINGTFNALGVPFFYTGTSATFITAATYGPLYLVPGSGSPTYTLLSGPLVPYHLVIGDGTNAVTVSGTSNNPTINVTGDLIIRSNATFVSPNTVDSNYKGNWTNSGTYTPSGRLVIFDATTTGKTINPGSSSFYDAQFNSSVGGWTITGSATSTHNTLLSSVLNFALSSGKSLEVDGTFTNSIASSTQTWTGANLYLNSGTSYSINTKSAGNATYGQITVGANTNIRNWNSYAATTSVRSTGSLYAQNFASSTGKLYIWGAYSNAASDYWDYDTDFDGISLGATARKVDVYVASSSSLTFSSGLLDIIGATTASTTVQVQNSGAYAFSVTGGTLNAQYYQIRNTDPSGLSLSGYPTITGLNNGDFLVASSSNSAITVNGTVLSVNQLKVIKYVKFATTSPAISAFNVTATNATSSFWKFNLGYGNAYGEAYDNDPGGDPGFIRFDDSADHIDISGRVFSDEGTTASSGCDGSTQNIRLKVQGAGSYQASCLAGTGAYTITNIGYNPGDVFTLYFASTSKRSATVTRGMTANIANLDLYEHRVIVRQEDSTPINIADLDQYDSGQDSLVPFLATVAGTNTLVVEANTKLIVWTGKTFAPAGNVTLQSGGVGGAVDGTLELYANSTFTAAATQSHSVGGSFLVDSGATFTAANSTVTFAATTTGKTITPSTSNFYNITFNGAGGNWAFSGAATSTNDFAIANGTVTLPFGPLEVGGSFLNSGGTFQPNNGLVKLTSTATEKSVQVNGSLFNNLTADGIGGSWRFVDAIATTTNNFTITNGTFRAPSTTLAIGGNFANAGTFTANTGTVKMFSTTGGNTIQAGGSDFYSLLFSGVGGGWLFSDINATTSRNMTIATGTVRLPSGTLAIGGSFAASSTFTNNAGIVRFTATTTGFSIGVGTSTFSSLVFDAAAGGWSIYTNATSTATTSIANASSLTLQSGKTWEVDGTFTNSAGAGTTWTSAALYLNSGTSYSINSRGAAAEAYGQLTLGINTNVKSWNSSAATTTAGSGASLYSQNHANVSGSLYIFGAFTSSGTEYWSDATDFDGTDISGTPRQAQVRIATSSSVSFSGATLNIIGISTATTTIYTSGTPGTTSYGFTFSGGTLNASFYQFKNMDSNGVALTNSTAVSSLANGDFELSAASGTAMSVASSVVDANSGITISTVKFSSTTANLTKGYNVQLTSTPGSFWTFTGSYGNISGESFDLDGPATTVCGHVRWDDSDCQFLNEAHYRWRNDDGGEGAISTSWFDNSWTRREKVVITNPNATAYTNLPVKLVIPYDSDMLSTFNDLRFTDSSGTTTIPFWREFVNASASTTVWVKIASLPAGGSATVYFYYGNGSATAADDGANTFPFFEDWESGSFTGYSGDIGGTVFSTSTSKSYGIGAIGLVGTSGATPNGLYKTGTQTGTGKTIRWFQYVDPSGTTDEPCTLFGVQPSYSAATPLDYAVCLDNSTNVPANLFPRVSIAQDTHTRDVAGLTPVLASTTANWSTNPAQWYQVVVDWISGSPKNTISVNVYDSSGNLFKTLSTTSSSYSSGGIGYSYQNQIKGAWDATTVKTYTPVAPTYNFGSEQLNNGATWKAAEDTVATGVLPSQNVRLRFSLQNTGTAAANKLFTLQFAPKAGAANCESVPPINFADVPQAGSCSSAAACMTSSSQFTNLASTSPALSNPASQAWASGYMLQNTSNATPLMSLAHNTTTELEYNFQITNSATQTAYCFRINDGGLGGFELPNYDHVAEADIAYPPVFLDPIDLIDSLTGSTTIILMEGATTTVYASTTVTDNNGYADITSATSTIYRSGVTNGASCTANDSNCYQISSSSCTLSSCAGTRCTLQCRADLQYFADPTDAVATFAAQTWAGTIAVQDSSGLRTTQTSLISPTSYDVNTTRGLDVLTGDLDFGTLDIGSNTGTTNATTTVKNTGNSPISINVSGTALGYGTPSFIATSSQVYATTTFAYGSCAICQALSGSAANVNVNISKATSTTDTTEKQDVYFGFGVPSISPNGTFHGTNTFEATGPP